MKTHTRGEHVTPEEHQCDKKFQSKNKLSLHVKDSHSVYPVPRHSDTHQHTATHSTENIPPGDVSPVAGLDVSAQKKRRRSSSADDSDSFPGRKQLKISESTAVKEGVTSHETHIASK